jgi:hypothetical protein
MVAGAASTTFTSALVARATNMVATATLNDTIMITLFGFLVIVGLFLYFWWISRTKRQ